MMPSASFRIVQLEQQLPSKHHRFSFEALRPDPAFAVNDGTVCCTSHSRFWHKADIGHR
jgi:hypothetical protein